MDTQQFAQIMAYENEDVIDRFLNMMKVSENEAKSIFTETKKFLFLSQLPGVFIPDELLILDEMWHNFILFTKDYDAFCNNHFGHFLHHQPALKAEKFAQKELYKNDQNQAKSIFNEKLGVLISCTYDQFGEETVLNWFSTYPKIYSPANIKKLRKV